MPSTFGIDSFSSPFSIDGGASLPGGGGGMVPTSLGFGDLLGAGSSVLSGVGGYIQGQESASANEYNAQLALIEGDFQKEQLGKDENVLLSTQRAMYSKAGVELSGSPLDVAVQTATNYEYDKQVATFNSQSKARMYQYEADVAKQKGKFDLGMGLLQGGMGLALALL